MLNHTPGPWKCYNAKGNSGRILKKWRVDSPGGPICTVEEQPKAFSTMDTAVLIASAPELLEALQEAEKVIRWAVQVSKGRVKAEVVGGWQYHADKVHAVIDKAEKGA